MCSPNPVSGPKCSSLPSLALNYSHGPAQRETSLNGGSFGLKTPPTKPSQGRQPTPRQSLSDHASLSHGREDIPTSQLLQPSASGPKSGEVISTQFSVHVPDSKRCSCANVRLFKLQALSPKSPFLLLCSLPEPEPAQSPHGGTKCTSRKWPTRRNSRLHTLDTVSSRI